LNLKESLKNGFLECENSFIEMGQNIQNYNIANVSLSQNNVERSGSCAVVVLVVNDMV